MTDRETDKFWMQRALAEAEKGRGWVEPNPMVGAVIVQRGELVAVGHHNRFGDPHAEVHALRQAGDRARGATLYVTLEPCCHTGKTPPCTEAIVAAGIARVVAAVRDPFPQVAGQGFARLRQAGLEVVEGIGQAHAERLLAPFLKRQRTGLPYVIAKWAMTLDGKTAAASGDSKWISNARSRALVHEVRGRVDAIAVGIGTALADDPELTARPAGPRRAARLVLDSQARLPLDSRLVRSASEIPVWVAVNEQAPRERTEALRAAGCEILALPDTDRVPIRPLLEELGRRAVTNLLVEGGGTVLGAFFDAGQVDEVDVFIAPVIEGGSHTHSPARGQGVLRMAEALRLNELTISQIDGDVRIQGTLPADWRDR